MKSFLLSIVAIASVVTNVSAANSNPFPIEYTQPDGGKTPPLYMGGGTKYHWLSDENGYTVIQDEHGWYVYAKKVDGDLVPTHARVGHKNPKKLGLSVGISHDEDKRATLMEDDNESEKRSLISTPEISLCSHDATKDTPCRLKGMAVLVRFSDHANRILPEAAEYDTLFNNNGPDATICPTGSVSDVFLENSYQTFVYETGVSPWIAISCTEAGAVGTNNGRNNQAIRKCWDEALEKYDETGVDFKDYDENDNGYLDALVFLHSGSAAERGGIDCETDQGEAGRIWSHAVGGSGGLTYSGDGVKPLGFVVVSAIFGDCPPNGKYTLWKICRIGVIAHEMTHFLTLPDLYDTSKQGFGVGTFDMLGNMWGWYEDTAQLYPPMLCAWSKMRLGWAKVNHITESTFLSLYRACDNDEILMIDHNMLADEYFLLEFRYPCKFDIELHHLKGWWFDRSGAALFHIDDTSDQVSMTTPGIPEDGVSYNHYSVNLVESDGQFNLEKFPHMPAGDGNRGDNTDLFMNMWAWPTIYNPKKGYKIDNNGVYMSDGVTSYPQPTTQGYARGHGNNGKQYNTGISLQFGGYATSIDIDIKLNSV